MVSMSMLAYCVVGLPLFVGFLVGEGGLACEGSSSSTAEVLGAVGVRLFCVLWASTAMGSCAELD